MTQDLYLGKNTALDIGAVALTPAQTNVSIVDESTFERYRPYETNYSDVAFLRGGRSIGLAGVYYGPQADALRALVGVAGQQPWRFVLDAGGGDYLMAGNCLVSTLSLDAPTESAVVVTGTAPASGPTYIGRGRYTDTSAHYRLGRD